MRSWVALGLAVLSACTPELAIGEACVGGDCPALLDCVQGADCRSTCQAQPLEGEECSFATDSDGSCSVRRQCAPGLACITRDVVAGIESRGLCAVPRATGAACTSDYECAQDAVCDRALATCAPVACTARNGCAADEGCRVTSEEPGCGASCVPLAREGELCATFGPGPCEQLALACAQDLACVRDDDGARAFCR